MRVCSSLELSEPVRCLAFEKPLYDCLDTRKQRSLRCTVASMRQTSSRTNQKLGADIATHLALGTVLRVENDPKRGYHKDVVERILSGIEALQ